MTEEEIEDVIAITMRNQTKSAAFAGGDDERLQLAEVKAAIDMPRQERHKQAETTRRASRPNVSFAVGKQPQI